MDIGGIISAVDPLVVLIMGIIKAHQNATNGQWPTPEQVTAALPADTQTLGALWATWSGDHPAPVPPLPEPPA